MVYIPLASYKGKLVSIIYRKFGKKVTGQGLRIVLYGLSDSNRKIVETKSLPLKHMHT